MWYWKRWSVIFWQNNKFVIVKPGQKLGRNAPCSKRDMICRLAEHYGIENHCERTIEIDIKIMIISVSAVAGRRLVGCHEVSV